MKTVKTTDSPTIQLDGFSLTIEKVVALSTKNGSGCYPKVVIAKSALKKVRICAEFIKKKAEIDKEIIYGVTTGFGSKADTAIELSHAKELQRNLLLSHSTGMGANLPTEIVRAMMVIRLNTLLQGHSGVQIPTVELLQELLNHEVHPVIPSQGSVGASGDLCPLSHMALPLIGEGEVTIGDDPTILQSRVALKKLKLSPIELSYKEGLALNNGTALMTALGSLAVYESKQVLRLATSVSAMAFEALCARSDSYAYAPIHKIRNHSGQIVVARWLTTLLQGSTHIDMHMSDVLDNERLNILITKNICSESKQLMLLEELDRILNAEPHRQRKFSAELYKCVPTEGEGSEWKKMLEFAEKKFKIQDSYSIRCIPQVLGASYSAIEHVEQIISHELNAAVDNPLLFLEELHGELGVTNDKVISGGNFHGEPLGMALDYLKLAVSEIGSIIERQINKLVDSSTNDGLPSFLVNSGGLNSGLMVSQYVAAAIASENKSLVHPATADSIPTCENTEDHVSMAPIAGRQALEIINNVKKILAIALLTSYQGISLRKHQFAGCDVKVNKKSPALSRKTQELYTMIQQILVERFEHNDNWLSADRYLAPELKELLEQFPLFYSFTEKYIKE